MNRLLLVIAATTLLVSHPAVGLEGRTPAASVTVYDYPFVGVVSGSFDLKTTDLLDAQVGGEPFFPWIKLDVAKDTDLEWLAFKERYRGPHTFVTHGMRVVFSGYIGDFGDPPVWRRLSGLDARREPGKGQPKTRAALNRLAELFRSSSRPDSSISEFSFHTVTVSFDFNHLSIEAAKQADAPAGEFAIEFELTPDGIEDRDWYSIHSEGHDTVFIFADVMMTVSFNRPARDRLIMRGAFADGFTPKHLDALIALYQPS
ncbi:MAG: hypothetical protein ACE363_12355 [Alphaproteobacteria bacterium]